MLAARVRGGLDPNTLGPAGRAEVEGLRGAGLLEPGSGFEPTLRGRLMADFMVRRIVEAAEAAGELD